MNGFEFEIAMLLHGLYGCVAFKDDRKKLIVVSFIWAVIALVLGVLGR